MADQAGADAPTRSESATPLQSVPSDSLYGGTGSGRVNVRDLAAAKAAGERWPMLTAYDALTAGVFDEAGIPVLLVGDSASMVVYGHDTTLPVEVDDLLPLVAAVVRGTRRAMVVADLPFGSYEGSPQQALETASRFMKAGAHAVKFEGGARVAPQVEALVSAGVPVMAHLGLTPQSVNVFGGYRVQGRGEAGDRLLHDAKTLQHAGAFAVVLEVVPEELATRVTEQLDIPTIGIGAGGGTDAQVLVWQDLVGLSPGPGAKFVRKYADLRSVLTSAVQEWAGDVISGAYPDAGHTYH
jgi:3-methyl-2-oxobutanoate hydroxymethyltransferase